MQLLDTLWKEIRYAIRQLLKSPGFTCVAILSLALGIGAGTAVFSVLNTILLRSLPVPNPNELRLLRWLGDGNRIPSWDGGSSSVSPPLFFRLREQGAPQADIFGFLPLGNVMVRWPGNTLIAEGTMVSDNFFSGLGITPFIGRMFTSTDDYGTAMNMLISYEWWEKYFAFDPGILGRTVLLNGKSFTVVGVVTRGFSGVQPGSPSGFYVPMSAHSPFLYRPITDTFHWCVRLMARLKPGAEDGRLQSALQVVFQREVASVIEKPKIFIEPGYGGQSNNQGYYRKSLFLMLGIVGMVLLTACANLAGLSLARGAARRHEWALRAALGAGCRRLIRQSLIESFLLALFGAGVGILLALWGRDIIIQFLAQTVGEMRYDFSLDLTVLGFSVTVALLTAVLSGLLPALRAGRADPLDGLKGRNALDVPRLRVGRILVAVQICLSLLLLTGAGLCVRTLINLRQIDTGFPVENLLLCRLNIKGTNYADEHPVSFYERVQSEISSLPGVKNTAFLEFPLLSNSNSSGGITLSGITTPRNISTCRLTVGETFLTTMGIPLLRGRDLSLTDREGTSKVVVVNESFAQAFLPEVNNPIGHTLRMWEAEWQVVGVCRNTKYSNLKETACPTAYFPYRQRFYSRFRKAHLRNPYFAVRTTLPPQAIAPAIRKAVGAIDPEVLIENITTQEEVRDQTIGQERLFAQLCGALALLALLLAGIGLYGLMAYHVNRRINEFGIRMALGAQPGDIALPILREALLLSVIGVLGGLPMTMALTQLMENRLFGVQSNDPITYLLVIVLLVGITLFAAWFPARRAARIDPMTALRSE